MADNMFQQLDEVLAQLTTEELNDFMSFVLHASDDEFRSALVRKTVADYVMKEIRGRIRGEISDLHNWTRSAVRYYAERIRHVDNRTSIRAERGQADELVTSGE